MRREVKKLKIYLGRVTRDVARKIEGDGEPEQRFARLLGLVERLLSQEHHDKNKLYSLHAPEVVCIAKGKPHKRYEFGAKVAVAISNHEGFVLASKALPASGGLRGPTGATVRPKPLSRPHARPNRRAGPPHHRHRTQTLLR